MRYDNSAGDAADIHNYIAVMQLAMSLLFLLWFAQTRIGNILVVVCNVRCNVQVSSAIHSILVVVLVSYVLH